MKDLGLILAYLHSRVVAGGDLFGGPQEEVLDRFSSLGGNRAYKDLRRAVQGGESLAGAFARMRAPQFYTQLLSRAEAAGRLAPGLEAAMDRHSIRNTLRRHRGLIYSWVLVLLGFLLAFLLIYSRFVATIFRDLDLVDGAVDPSLAYRWFTPFMSDGMIMALCALFVLLCLAVFFGGRFNPLEFLLRKLTGLNRLYGRVLSLEIGILFLFSLQLGRTTVEALEETARGLGDRRTASDLESAAAAMENGASFREAALDRPGLSDLSAIRTIGLGLETGRLNEMLEENNALYRQRLAGQLERYMGSLFQVIVVFGGLAVGFWVLVAYQALFQAYGLQAVF